MPDAGSGHGRADARGSSGSWPDCPRFPHAKHFPAMEAPADLAADLQAFFGPLS